MKFKPLQDRVVVKRLESDEKSSGGIIIPDTAKEKPSEGEIVAVGPGELTEDGKLKPMNVKQGDKILFGKCHKLNVIAGSRNCDYKCTDGGGCEVSYVGPPHEGRTQVRRGGGVNQHKDCYLQYPCIKHHSH